MKDLAGRVAVVTGAASGIGLALALGFADEGMHVVLADVEGEPLAMAEAAVRARGAKTLALRTDVLVPDDVERLADASFRAFGNVHVLCNNAGVGAGIAGTSDKAAWERPMTDWEWILGVNLMGVLRGIRAFVPRMIESGEDGHIVNTASVAGLLTRADPYNVSKHAVVCVSEGLYKEFKRRGLNLSASALCPGWVNTQILEAERNRPLQFGPPEDRTAQSPEVQRRRASVEQLLKGGYAPDEIARQVVEAIHADRFYVIPAQPEFREMIARRFDDLLNGRNPAYGPS